MNIYVVVILSIVQAVTEFLPISSSAHLLLVPWVFNFTNPGLAFDAALHIGTALALLVFFGKEFWQMLLKKDKLIKYIIIATLPALFIGYFGDKYIEHYLHASSYAPLVLAIGMILFGFLLLYVDKTAKLQESVDKITLKQSVIIGFAQAVALIPGTSRSGITITAGLWLGLKREDAARFSFLLATPISLGAGLYKALSLVKEPVKSISNLDLILGIVVTFAVGLLVIKWLLDYLKSHSMLIFVLYRIILGLGIIAIWLIRR